MTGFGKKFSEALVLVGLTGVVACGDTNAAEMPSMFRGVWGDRYIVQLKSCRLIWCFGKTPNPANYSDLRAVRHAELAHDLPNMKFDGTFSHGRRRRNAFVEIAIAKRCEAPPLPGC